MSTALQKEIVLDHFKDALWGTHGMRYVVLCGGAGSGKSHAICQKFTQMFLTMPDMVFAVVRATMPALRKSVYLGSPSIIEQLGKWGVKAYTWLNKTEATLTNPENGSVMYFIALDDKEKIKSMNINYIFIEEATELTLDKWRQLDTRMRRDNPLGPNQMFLAYNPISYNNWVVQTFDVKPSDDPIKQKTYMHFSNFLNNPYCKREDIESWLATARQSPEYYYTYIKGKPGVPRGLIYPNFTFTPADYWDNKVWSETPYYGIDWGFVDPMVLVEVRKHEDTYYVRCLYYYSEKTTDDLIQFMKAKNISRSARIYCDSAEPDRRNELIKSGFLAAMKAVKRVKATISHLKGLRIIIDSSGVTGELARNEAAGYTFQHNKEDMDKFIDEPEDGNDHFCQAVGYAIYTDDLKNSNVAVGSLAMTPTDGMEIDGFDDAMDVFDPSPMERGRIPLRTYPV